MILSLKIKQIIHFIVLTLFLYISPQIFAQNVHINPQTGIHYINRAFRYDFDQDQSWPKDVAPKNPYITNKFPGKFYRPVDTNNYPALNLNPEGVELRWIKDIGMKESEPYWAPTDIAIDQSNHLYLMHTEVNLPERNNYYVTKYDSVGHQIWQDKYNGSVNGDDFGLNIYIDSEGNIISIGTADFRETVITRKYNTDGGLFWEHAFTDARKPYVNETRIGYDDNVYQLIQLSGSAWNPGETVLYRDTLIIHKLDKFGNFSVLIHDPMDEEGVQTVSFMHSFNVDAKGNVYALTIRNRASFNDEELVLRKYDKNGKNLWEKLISEHISWSIHDFVLNEKGQIYISYLQDDPIRERVLTKYDSDGNQLWYRQRTWSDEDNSNVILKVTASSQILHSAGNRIDCYADSGRLVWSKTFTEELKTFDFDKKENIYISSIQNGSVYLAKLALTDGSEIWKNEYYISSDYIYYYPRIKTDNVDDVYILIATDCSGRGSCGLLLKYDKDGALLDDSRFDQTCTINDRLEYIVRNNKGDIYIFQSNKSNLWIHQYNSDGILIRTKSMQQISLVYNSKPQLDDQGFIYLMAQHANERTRGVIKLNSNLDIMWRTFVPLHENVNYYWICFDLNNSGESVIGYISSTFDDTGRGETNTLHVNKFDKNGQVRWQKSYASNSWELRSLKMDLHGNVYCASIFEIIKINKDGSETWRKTYENRIWDFIIDKWGYPTVKFYENYEQLVFVKFSPAGEILWQYFHEFREDEIYNYKRRHPKMICDAFGRIIVTFFSSGYYDLLSKSIIVLDRHGKLEWSKRDQGFYPIDNIQADSKGNIYLTGHFVAEPRGMPGVQKYDFDGNLCQTISVPINESFEYLNVQSVLSKDDNIFIAAEISGRYWSVIKFAKFSQTGEDAPNQSIPELQVKQNFPNPFNNQTTIIYRIPDLTHVILKVYDLNGRLVIDDDLGQRAKGEYTYFIDSRYLASGTYYYQVKTDTEAKTAKMVLVK